MQAATAITMVQHIEDQQTHMLRLEQELTASRKDAQMRDARLTASIEALFAKVDAKVDALARRPQRRGARGKHRLRGTGSSALDAFDGSSDIGEDQLQDGEHRASKHAPGRVHSRLKKQELRSHGNDLEA
jgi:hypothetical protein